MSGPRSDVGGEGAEREGGTLPCHLSHDACDVPNALTPLPWREWQTKLRMVSVGSEVIQIETLPLPSAACWVDQPVEVV